MSERSVRDELESLQAELAGVRAELAKVTSHEVVAQERSQLLASLRALEAERGALRDTLDAASRRSTALEKQLREDGRTLERTRRRVVELDPLGPELAESRSNWEPQPRSLIRGASNDDDISAPPAYIWALIPKPGQVALIVLGVLFALYVLFRV